jgi:hypothetical protein
MITPEILTTYPWQDWHLFVPETVVGVLTWPKFARTLLRIRITPTPEGLQFGYKVIEAKPAPVGYNEVVLLTPTGGMTPQRQEWLRTIDEYRSRNYVRGE